MFSIKRRTAMVIGAAAAALALGAGGTAYAATSGSTATQRGACVRNDTASFTTARWWLHMPLPAHCPAGWSWWPAPAGATGPVGPRGPQGPQGAQGPSGVVSSLTKDLGGVASVATGGSFVSRAAEVGTIDLKAGVYLVSVNAKATPPSGGTGTVQVFPQFFVYNQPANASFAGDLFNVGSGALENGANAQIDSYYSGSTTITLASDTTLHVYAFGYDSDRGASSYALDDLSVTATAINAG